MGVVRIKRNLGLDTDDVVAWCKQAVDRTDNKSIIKKGKNWYVHGDGYVLTINVNSNTIITAHKV
ncbi:DUF3781 domain-containing protein [Treponema primitia]